MDLSDEQLVEKYISGDESALKILFNRYLNLTYRFVFGFIQDAEISTDLTQDIFIKVWKGLNRFDKNKSFKIWIYIISKRTIIDYFRKKKSVLFLDINEDLDIPDIENDLNNNLSLFEKIDDHKHLIDMINILPLHYKIVINLHYFNELTFNEISEITEESINTVKSRHRRALVKLKDILDNKT